MTVSGGDLARLDDLNVGDEGLVGCAAGQAGVVETENAAFGLLGSNKGGGGAWPGGEDRASASCSQFDIWSRIVMISLTCP
jgi:hypothetical protein